MVCYYGSDHPSYYMSMPLIFPNLTLFTALRIISGTNSEMVRFFIHWNIWNHPDPVHKIRFFLWITYKDKCNCIRKPVGKCIGSRST